MFVGSALKQLEKKTWLIRHRSVSAWTFYPICLGGGTIVDPNGVGGGAILGDIDTQNLKGQRGGGWVSKGMWSNPKRIS